MAALQTRPFESTVQLGIGGLTYGDVTVLIRKQGGVSLVAKTMDSTNFLDLGNGYYAIRWSSSYMDTLGAFFFSISGTTFDTLNGEISIEPLPQELVVIPPDICMILGNLRDISSTPMRDMQVTFRAVNYPLQSGTSILSADKVLARTDSLGNFSAPLIRGMTVIVEAERTGIRNQFVVPDAPTALLNDLIVFPVI